MKTLIQKNQVITFVILSYSISWLCWLPIVSQINADLYSSPWFVIVLLLLGGYSPTISGLLLSYSIGGKQALKELANRFKILKVEFKWYAIAVNVGPVLGAIATLIYSLQGGVLGWVNYMVFLFFPVFMVVASIFGPLGEELGWRGFLLPRVLGKYDVFTASLWVGIIWAFWHTPLYWAQEGTSISGVPVTPFSILNYVVFCIGMSLIISLVLKNTRNSVFIAFLIHASSNGSGVALSYLFPNMVDKKAIWNIEVYVLGTFLVIYGIFHFMKMLKAKKSDQ